MANRLISRPAREGGPTPFTSDWHQAPAAAPPPRSIVVLPTWFPGERLLTAGLVLLLAATIAIGAGTSGGPTGDDDGTDGEVSLLSAPDAVPASELAAATEETTTEVVPTAPPPTLVPTATDAPALAPPTAEPAAPTPPTAPAPTPTFVPAPAVAEEASVGGEQTGALLPTVRILTYYGHPHDENMGILGEYEKEELHEILKQEAANYQAADPSRPVVLAFELIATVAQPVPGSDGTYILDTDLGTLQEYADYAANHDMLVFLDLQIGRGTVEAEIEKVRPLLALPHIHLALDPEFAIDEGETPGDYIGSLDAESIIYAQQTLAEISAANGIPPKVLIVHQFREDMITNKQQLGPMPGVQLVIDADGFGAPVLKTDVYNILVRDEPVEFGGVKLFYKQDKPVMTAAEILALNPSPDLIIYQ